MIPLPEPSWYTTSFTFSIFSSHDRNDPSTSSYILRAGTWLELLNSRRPSQLLNRVQWKQSSTWAQQSAVTSRKIKQDTYSRSEPLVACNPSPPSVSLTRIGKTSLSASLASNTLDRHNQRLVILLLIGIC